MLEGWNDADNWIQFADHVLWVAGIVVVTFVGRTSWKNRNTLKEVKSQVVNGHSDPLRTDLDRVIVMVNDIARNVAEIRNDLTEERDRRRYSIEDLRDDMARMEKSNGRCRHDDR